MSAATILVADDDEDILLLVATRLKRDGFDVVTARNGVEALELVREHRPEVAVLDISMPPPNGLDVCREIRADTDLDETRLVLLTAKARHADVQTGYSAGADAYVSKPFSPAELSARVRELLGYAGGE